MCDTPSTVGVFDSGPIVEPILKEVTSVLPGNESQFSDISNPDIISNICLENLKAWKDIPKESIKIHQLMEGLSNQIFKVSVQKTPAPSFDSVLFRIYGTCSTKFYDPVYENNVYHMLSTYRIGPRVLANGTGWRIEEWHKSVAVPVSILPNLSVCTQVASLLGRFHKLHQRADFPLPKGDNVFLKRLIQWSKEALKVSFEDETMRALLKRIHLESIVEETEEIVARLSSVKPAGVGQGYDVVFCHGDLQENNLLQTQYGIRFIDFEYAGFSFQAHDIANFFNEFTIDYLHPRYPFYRLDYSQYPDKETQQIFAAVYLSEYLETTVHPSDNTLVEPLLQAVEKFANISHIYWGLWSVVRSPIAPTFEEFDFLQYAQVRFDMFRRGKSRHLYKTEPDTAGKSPASIGTAVLFAGAVIFLCGCLTGLGVRRL